jgi:hypothetical protein
VSPLSSMCLLKFTFRQVAHRELDSNIAGHLTADKTVIDPIVKMVPAG